MTFETEDCGCEIMYDMDTAEWILVWPCPACKEVEE